MKGVFIGLAFLSCAYIGLGCFIQAMAGPQGPPPLTFVAFRCLAIGCTVCCVIALYQLKPAVIAVWIVAIGYDIFSWRFNPSWIFHSDVFYFSVWPPLFLTAALLASRWNAYLDRESH